MFVFLMKVVYLWNCMKSWYILENTRSLKSFLAKWKAMFCPRKLWQWKRTWKLRSCQSWWRQGHPIILAHCPCGAQTCFPTADRGRLLSALSSVFRLTVCICSGTGVPMLGDDTNPPEAKEHVVATCSQTVSECFLGDGQFFTFCE